MAWTRKSYYKAMQVSASTCKDCEGKGHVLWQEHHPYGETYVTESFEMDCPSCSERLCRVTSYYQIEEEMIDDIPF